jgi:hypothetical protein
MTTATTTRDIDPRTLADVRELISEAQHVSYNTRQQYLPERLELYIDRHDENVRFIVRLNIYTGNAVDTVTVSRLHNYDAEKHCWRDFGRETRRDIENRRGLKALRDDVRRLFDHTDDTYGHAGDFSAYPRTKGA